MTKRTTLQLTEPAEEAAQYLIECWGLSTERGRSAAINRAIEETAERERAKQSPTPRDCPRCGSRPLVERAPDQSKYRLVCPACLTDAAPASTYAGAVEAWNK